MGFCMFPSRNYPARFNGSNLSLAVLVEHAKHPFLPLYRIIAYGKCQFAGAKITHLFGISNSLVVFLLICYKIDQNIYYIMYAREKLYA